MKVLGFSFGINLNRKVATGDSWGEEKEEETYDWNELALN